MSESVELCARINTQMITRQHQDEELKMHDVRICETVVTNRHRKRDTMLSRMWFVKMIWRSWTRVVQNSTFGRVEMRFVQTVGGIRKMVPQNLGFRRVEATMCCGQYHFVATARPKKCPRSTIDFCLFHDMNLKIPRKINVWLYKYCHFEKALLRAPKMQEFNRVLCQIALGHPKI